VTHRTALTLSIALTFILAIGILVGRDRLFASEAIAGTTAATPPSSVSLAETPTEETNESLTTAPRVIEIPLPSTAQQESLRQIGRDEQQARSDDRDDEDEPERYDDEDDHGDEDEHEEEDDD
jgi:hypothetical protein